MEQAMDVTPTGQDAAPNVTFDEHGELQFSEKGLDAFKDLLKADVHDNTVRPTQEALEEDAKEKPEKEEKEPEKKEPETPKRKLKVDGQEIEVTEDELVTLAQQGKDYTKKTQQLAEERNAMAPYQALLNQLKTDPALSQHIAQYWKPQPKAVEAEKPKFDDPIEQLKWETKQEAIAEMRKEMQQTIGPLQQTQMAHARQQGLNQVKQQIQADPDFREVHTAIMGQVMALPGASELAAELQKGPQADLRNIRNSLAKNAFMQLDQDPASYVEAFQLHKQALAGRKKPAASTETTTEKPVETKRTERAPILETPGNAPTEDAARSQAAKIGKAKAKMLREGGVEALQGFLEAGGFLDHLK